VGVEPTFNFTGARRSGARNVESLVKFVVEQSAARLVGLKPLPIDDQLRNGPFADVSNQLVGGAGVLVDIDFGVGNAVRIKKLLGCATIAAPRSRINLHVHTTILPFPRCYHNVEMTAEEIKDLLKLEPHPLEGGWFRRTYTSSETVEFPRGLRTYGSAIYYLLEPGTFSEMHVLESDEVFHFYVGDPVEMLQLYSDGGSAVFILGHDLKAGQHVQVVVPAGVWQGTRLIGEGKVALLGCTVTPGFNYADYHNGKFADLGEKWPDQAQRIRALTRG
jgi:predicted cupin superfamily sugar epimerase